MESLVTMSGRCGKRKLLQATQAKATGSIEKENNNLKHSREALIVI